MKNPLFKAGIKAGTHRLNDPGVERRIKIKNIRSPQMTVDEKKVKALSRFTKNMPGTPTVSHAGHGKWTLKDGNHRVAAAMKQGKRVINVRVQRMHSLDKPTLLGTAMSPLRILSSRMDSILFATGRSEKYLPGTGWDRDVQVKDEATGKLKKKPSLAKEYYKAVIQQKEPRSISIKKNRGEPDWVGERGVDRSQNPDLFRTVTESPVQHGAKDSKGRPRRTIDDPAAPGGRRQIMPKDLLNTEGYRTLKKKQLSTDLIPWTRAGWSEADLNAHDVPEAQRAILRGGTDAASPKLRTQIRRVAVDVRKKMVSGDVRPELTNMRTAIARDADVNRRIVHQIRKQDGGAGFFRKPDDNVVPFNKASESTAHQKQSAYLASARANFDTHLAGEEARRKAQAGQIHDMVRQKAHEALVAQEHGPDWKSKLTGRKLTDAFAKHEKSAQNYAKPITSPVAVSHDDLGALIGAKPEGLAKVRENYNNLIQSDYKTHRQIQNRIIRSGKIFDGTPAFSPTAPKAAVKAGYPTLKKIGIAGAVVGGGLLAHQLIKKRREQQEPQLQLMSSRGPAIRFGKKFPIPKAAEKKLSDLAERLLRKSSGETEVRERIMSRIPGGKPPGPELPASQWAQVESAQDLSPEATELVQSGKNKLRAALQKPGGLKALQPEHIIGEKTAAGMSPMDKGLFKNKKAKLASVATPLVMRGTRAAMAQGRTVSDVVERGDVEGVKALFARPGPHRPPVSVFKPGTVERVTVDPAPKMIPLTTEQAQRRLAVERNKKAGIIRGDRSAKRGYIQRTGQNPDTVVVHARSAALLAKVDKNKAEEAARKGIAAARDNAKAEVRKASQQATEAQGRALGKQAATHGEQMKKAKSAAWRNTAIGTGAGFIGGAAIAGNASRQTYEPKKQLQQPVRKLLMSARSRPIRFSDMITRKKDTTGHDIATGALEGSLGLPVAMNVENRLLHGSWVNPIAKSTGEWKGLGKRMAIGGLVGAGMTGLIGSLVNNADKARREKIKQDGKPILFAYQPRSAIAKDRYQNTVFDKDENRAGTNYSRSALAGGALSVLLRGKKTRLGTFVAGAGAGIGAQAATRALTSASEDQFGDRSIAGKRIDRLPWQVPAAVAAGIIGKRAYKAGALKLGRKGKLIEFISYDPVAVTEDDKNWRKATGQINRATQNIKRGTRLTQDIVRAAKGQKNLDSRGRERKREWDKPWVRKVLTGTIAVGTLAGFHKVIKSTGPASQLGRAKEMWHNGTFHDAAREKVPGFAKAHDWVRGFKKSAPEEAGAVAENSGVLGRVLNKVQKASGRTGKQPVHVVGQGGAVTTLHPGTTAYDAHMKKTAPAPEHAAAQDAAQADAEELRKLKNVQQGKLFTDMAAKLDAILFAAEDWEERQHGDLLHVAKIRRRDRREKTPLERKDWQRSVVVPAMLGGSLLTGALGARLLGPRITAAGAKATARRAAETVDLRPELKKAMGLRSINPLVTLNARLSRLLEFGDEEPKKKDLRGLHIAEAAIGTGLTAYGLMRRRTPLKKGASQNLKSIREAAEKHGFVRVEHQDRFPGAARTGADPTVFQKIKSAIFHPADRHEHLVEGSRYTQGKKTKEAVFDPENSGRLSSEASIGQNRRSRRLETAIDRSKLDEYKIATGMGIPMPHTLPLTDATQIKKGYIAKAATGSQSKIVVTRKMIAQHNPQHPDLLQYKKFRKISKRAIKDPNILGPALNSHPGYGRWMAEQAIQKPGNFVQQKALKIASEHRVHTIGGEAIGITSGRHGVAAGAVNAVTGRNRQAEKAVNKLLEKAKPNLQGTMMAVDTAKDTKGKWHVIETNPGTQSGFLTPQSRLDVRGPNQLYKLVTGRHSQAASGAAAGAAALAAGAIEARATRDDKRKPRAIAAA